MSEIKVDTLTGKTTANDITVTVGATATQSLEQGLAKAWINYDGTSTGAVSTWARDSLNLSVITDTGNGNHTVGFSSNMSNANYTPQITSVDVTCAGVEQASDMTTSSIKIRTHNDSGTPLDRDYTGAVVFGDLA